MEHKSIGDEVNIVHGPYVGRTGVVIDWIDTGSGQVILVHLCYELGGHRLFTADQLEVIMAKRIPATGERVKVTQGKDKGREGIVREIDWTTYNDTFFVRLDGETCRIDIFYQTEIEVVDS